MNASYEGRWSAGAGEVRGGERPEWPKGGGSCVYNSPLNAGNWGYDLTHLSQRPCLSFRTEELPRIRTSASFVRNSGIRL